MRSFIRLTVLAALAVSTQSCKRADDRRTKQDPAAADGKAESSAGPAATKPTGPTGKVTGTIAFTGTAPEMPVLRRGADPVCAAREMRAETILVNGNGTLRNVLVRVKPGTVPGWAPAAPVLVDQVDCMYRPRVQGGVVGQKLVVKNSDDTAHNVHLRSVELGQRQGVDSLWNRQQPARTRPIESTIEKADVIRFKCDQHGWMSGYVVVSDNGYFTVTGDDGSFDLEVPAGEVTVEAWHEFYGVKEQTVTVAEGGAAAVAFSFDAEADDPTRSRKLDEAAGDPTAKGVAP